jgi:diphthamide synthase (EF-2-diphthine--ammonia ligase)
MEQMTSTSKEGLAQIQVAFEYGTDVDAALSKMQQAIGKAALPDGVDPCGENGEFHTFVTDGPGFSAPIPVTAGEVVHRDGFSFADLLPAGAGAG